MLRGGRAIAFVNPFFRASGGRRGDQGAGARRVISFDQLLADAPE